MSEARYTVLVTATNYSQLCAPAKAQLEAFGCRIIESTYGRPLTFEELQPHLPHIDAVIAGVDSWNEEVFRLAPRLKVIGRFGVGVDNIDLEAAERHGVTVVNVPGGNANAVAELCVGLILSLMRGLPDLTASTRAGGWERFVGTELEGRTVGLLGFGNIAQMVARKLGGFGVRLLAYDKYPNTARAAELSVQLVSFAEVLSQSDVVSMHMPSLPETKHAISTAQFGAMKPGALFVNTSRGALVDEAALKQALENRVIAGAAIDVYEREPVSPDNALLQLPNLMPTPHTAAETYETYERVGAATARAVMDVLSGKTPANTVRPAGAVAP